MSDLPNAKRQKDFHVQGRARRAGRALLVLAFAAGATLARAAAQGALTVLSSDATGVTLQFALPAYKVTSVDRPEGTFAHLSAPGLTSTVAVEGRPLLPADATLLGLP